MKKKKRNNHYTFWRRKNNCFPKEFAKSVIINWEAGRGKPFVEGKLSETSWKESCKPMKKCNLLKGKLCQLYPGVLWHFKDLEVECFLFNSCWITKKIHSQSSPWKYDMALLKSCFLFFFFFYSILKLKNI